jgi:branched-chain amino acid transport system ATP-binding protein
MLELSKISVRRGATQVLHEVDLKVEEGEIVALIGANGAGKSTTLLTISGLLRPVAGTVRWHADGREHNLNRLSPEAIVRAGVVHCPEGRQIFGSLSVAENLAMGAYTRADRADVARDVEEVYALFPLLKERARIAGGALSGGEQMMLAIGRALLARPRILLLDEPSLGLAPKMVEQIFDVIEDLRTRGTTCLLIEQNAAAALDIADRAYVMENGRIVTSGSGRELAADDAVRRAYLGGGA